MTCDYNFLADMIFQIYEQTNAKLGVNSYVNISSTFFSPSWTKAIIFSPSSVDISSSKVKVLSPATYYYSEIYLFDVRFHTQKYFMFLLGNYTDMRTSRCVI